MECRGDGRAFASVNPKMHLAPAMKRGEREMADSCHQVFCRVDAVWSPEAEWAIAFCRDIARFARKGL